jgi:hypothetical protein
MNRLKVKRLATMVLVLTAQVIGIGTGIGWVSGPVWDLTDPASFIILLAAFAACALGAYAWGWLDATWCSEAKPKEEIKR